MLQQEIVSGARIQAAISAIGFFTFISIGIVGCLALIVTLFYLLANFILLMLQAIVEACGMMALTWNSADPFCKILVLGAVAYGSYRLYQSRRKRN